MGLVYLAAFVVGIIIIGKIIEWFQSLLKAKEKEPELEKEISHRKYEVHVLSKKVDQITIQEGNYGLTNEQAAQVKASMTEIIREELKEEFEEWKKDYISNLNHESLRYMLDKIKKTKR